LKLLFVMVLLTSSLFVLIISIDLVMGIKFQGIISKALNPFRVMETAEYIILIFFILFFVANLIGAYLNKKRDDNSSSN
jgi:uncharacterized membrane protein